MKKIRNLVIMIVALCTSSISIAAETMVGQVNGMMCIKCQKMVTKELIKVSPTAHVKVSWPEGVAVSAFEDQSNLSLEEFKKAILGTGFEVVKVVKAEKFITDAGEARKLVD
jgi:copper chaperone CopZ